MFEEIDSTIQSVERLYRAVSGRESNGVEVAPIPPERDATKHVGEQVDKLLHALTPQRRSELPAWAPPVSLFAGEKELWVCVDVPGVARDGINVTATATTLVVSGRRTAPFEGQVRVARAEAAIGNFRREVPLPPGVALSDITAALKDGVLEIRVPRAAPLGPQSIPVQ